MSGSIDAFSCVPSLKPLPMTLIQDKHGHLYCAMSDRSGLVEALPPPQLAVGHSAEFGCRQSRLSLNVGQIWCVMRVKAVARAPGSNSAMSLDRFVLLLVCLLLPIRSVGAAVIVLGSDVNAVPVATHSTCIASVAFEHAVENADGATSDVQRPGSNHALDPTCASLCAMAAAPPVVAMYVTEPASLRLPGPTLSFQHFFAPPPHEPPRPTA